MNRDIKCPKCNEIISNENFDFRLDSDAPWYKFKKTYMHCPHCGARLKYELKTQIYIYFVSTIFLFSIVLVALELLTVYSIIMVPIVLAVIFWKFRKLCAY